MRRLARFLVSRWPEILVLVACEVLLAIITASTTIDRDAGILLAGTVALGWLIALGFSYLRSRTATMRLAAISEAAHPLDAAAQLDALPGPEGRAAYAALEATSIEARTRLGEQSRRHSDYRDYVESWVHEIKTPISATRLALDNNPGPGSAQLATQLDRISFLVDQALFYARSTALDRDYFIGEHSLASLVEQAVRERRRQLFDAGMAVNMAGIDSQMCVLADDTWLTFMLGQIIDNAVKYRAEANPALSFCAYAEGSGARARAVLTVEDNGLGIPAADVPRIFDKGFTGTRGRSGSASTTRATGLGLYLVGQLARAMAMEVWAESVEGEYTRIHLAFPVPAAS